MISVKDGNIIVSGITLEVMVECGMIAGTIFNVFKERGIEDADKRILRAVNYGIKHHNDLLMEADNA